jgi:DNA-directed RNA polymerase subunit beta
MTLLRAMSPDYSSDTQILRAFYKTEVVKLDPKSRPKIEGKIAAESVQFPVGHDRAGEEIVHAGDPITKTKADAICDSGVKKIEIMDEQRNKLLLNSLEEDKTRTHEEALLSIYKRLRQGNPEQIDKARDLFRERFYDPSRYRLGSVGRVRINRKLGINIAPETVTLCPEDIVQAISYLSRLWAGSENNPSLNVPEVFTNGTSQVEIDDIDHLGNRRIRTIDELACEELRKGFLKLRRTIQEKINTRTNDATPRQVVNQKSVSASIEYFFGRGELSQVVDQTNPLSMLTHERRLSALGPGGLNRKRAGFDTRDVHTSHYGRICPVETPEGTNIGLITSLAIYAEIDDYGFLVTPYRKVEKGKVTDEVVMLNAKEEGEVKVASADIKMDGNKLLGDPITNGVIARYRGDFALLPVNDIEYVDVSPSQMVGVSAGLIPFVEHDDANRALMGANMQRQAVPLLIAEPPLVATGMEKHAGQNSSLLVRARQDGTVTYVDSQRIIIDDEDEYIFRKFVGLNERTCQNQTPIVKLGEKVKKGQIIADGASMYHGELCLGRNVLVAFMSWEGFNFEDAIIISEELVQNDTYTSLHIDSFDLEVRETKIGHEEFTRDIPNVGDRALRNLDNGGIVKVGTYVRQGDILVGKVVPKQRTELTPEEKLLHAIFGRVGEEVKNESLEVPSGIEGIVIGTQRFCSRLSLSDEERRAFDKEVEQIEQDGNQKIAEVFGAMILEMEGVLGKEVVDDEGNAIVHDQNYKYIAEQASLFRIDHLDLPDKSPKLPKIEAIWRKHKKLVEGALDARDRRLRSLKRGDELKRNVLQAVKIYVATKRVISVGDKMAGRHGNKGVISKILPKEDMPFLADGTPIQILLNPLGVPSRMNVGQILETHLGWAAAKMGYQAVTPVFNGATEESINDCLEEAGLPRHGKVRLYDGRTGEPFDQETTVGYMYFLKLHHLVDDKVHARSTGPYSLITQQPLGGKARSGGQRLGEMEVWALEAYGAAYTLQELLTVKSDDVDGRTKIYESMVKGENTLEAGTPASFDVLTNEIRGLALNMQMERPHESNTIQM